MNAPTRHDTAPASLGTQSHVLPGDPTAELPPGERSDGLPPGEFARVWVARVQSLACGGRRHAVAVVIADQAREPGTRTVVLDEDGRRRVAAAAHILPTGLDRLLDRLTRDRFLTPVDHPVYELTLPPFSVVPGPPSSDRPAEADALTLEQAHRIMQRHLRCTTACCSRRRAALATLVDAGHYRLFSVSPRGSR